MKTRLLITLALFMNVTLIFCQSIEIKQPLSSTAFDSLLVGELNFMVLGEDNVKQGISYEYKENNTELNLSGKLTGNNKFIMSLDGKFTVDSGAFIFDETDGSKKGKLTLNLFFNIPWNSKFYSIRSIKKANDLDSKRAMFQNKIQTKALADTTYYKIMDFEVLMKELGLPYASIKNKKFKEQRALLDKLHLSAYDYDISNYNSVANKDRLLKRLKQYYKKEQIVNFDALLGELKKEITQSYDIMYYDKKEEKYKVLETYKVPANFKIEKFLKDYQETYAKLEAYETESNKLEIATFQKYWTGQRSYYAGVSPFYERQGFDIYNSGLPTTTSFKDRFTQINSDLYGINFSFNHVRLYKSGAFYIARALVGLGRSTNFTEYDKYDYTYTTSSESSNGIPIEVTKTKTGYSNRELRNYQFGFFNNVNLELYVAPIREAGIFAKIGFSKNDALLKQEDYPLEVGIMINLKSKEKKNIVAIQLFMARENLKVHPDDDMNFGLKIGLPIAVSKN